MSTFLNRLREHLPWASAGCASTESKPASFYALLAQHFTDVLYIFRHELIRVVKDEGVLMFLVVVPLGYPLLYSWIYNNESLHETPVVVVDQSHSALSRQFINDCDASPDVHIKYYAEDLDEARSLVSRQLVRAGTCERLLRYVAHACLQGRLSDCRGRGWTPWCRHEHQESG